MGLLRKLYVAVFVLILVVCGWGLYRVVSYAYESPSLEVSAISVVGLTHLSEGEVLARAGFVSGTNLLRLDLDQMRQSIEKLRWVRHARVQRIWPREIVISVIERAPIALARISGQMFQVDEDGVVLPIATATGDSPILNGLGLDDSEGNRALVDIYRTTVALIGEDSLSEVHVSQQGEVSVVPGDYPVLVDLGTDNHLERWEKYLAHRDWIQNEYPGASSVDLRFEGQIIVKSGDDQPARSITWDEETRRL